MVGNKAGKSVRPNLAQPKPATPAPKKRQADEDEFDDGCLISEGIL